MISLILASALFIPHDYETIDPFDRSFLAKSEYAEYVNWYKSLDDIEFLSISYTSENASVKAVIGKPKNIEHSLPVIIYNRGGSNDSGKLTVKTLKDKLYFWVKQGYIVIAPQYRGNDGGEGKDELGGLDVADVTNLFAVIRELPYTEPSKIYMLGHSRGAMMALMALRQQVPVKAAIVTGAVTDYFALDHLRPDLIPVFNDMMPNMPQNREEEYTKRSAVKWAQELNVPLLIMHGDADKIIDVSQSISLADQLQKHNKQYKLIIYPGGDHSLAAFRDETNQEALNWIKQINFSEEK